MGTAPRAICQRRSIISYYNKYYVVVSYYNKQLEDCEGDLPRSGTTSSGDSHCNHNQPVKTDPSQTQIACVVTSSHVERCSGVQRWLPGTYSGQHNIHVCHQWTQRQAKLLDEMCGARSRDQHRAGVTGLGVVREVVRDLEVDKREHCEPQCQRMSDNETKRPHKRDECECPQC